MIIEQVALRWVVGREILSRLTVNHYREDEEESIPDKGRALALQLVRNILNQLSCKHLVYLVAQKLVVNMPCVLYLYYTNLPAEAKERREERLNVEEYLSALATATGPFMSMPIVLSYDGVKAFVEHIVKKY